MSNKEKKLILIAIVFALTHFACTHKSSIERTILSPNKTLSDLNDSTFVPKQIMCMNLFENNLYMADYSEGILVLDGNLNVQNQIGHHGQGPGELLGTAHFYLTGRDSLFVLDEGRRSMELFVGDKPVKHIPFPPDIRMTTGTRFFVNNETIFHSVVAEKKPAVIFNEKSKVERLICEFTKWHTTHLPLHSESHLLKGEDRVFFLIGSVLPVFQVYSLDGNLKFDYDLRKIGEVAKGVRRYRATPQSPTTYFIMIQDAYYDNNKVYLLVATNDNGYFCNTVCVLNVKDIVEHIQTFQLSGRAYESLCVENNLLVAFNATDASLDFFTLPTK